MVIDGTRPGDWWYKVSHGLVISGTRSHMHGLVINGTWSHKTWSLVVQGLTWPGDWWYNVSHDLVIGGTRAHMTW